VKTVRLGDIADISSGGTPSRSKPEYWGGTIPWVKTAQIQNGRITEADVDEWLTEEGLKKSSAKVYPKGTILMAMYGQGKTRGQVAVLDVDASTNQACAAIQVNENADSGFVYQQLRYRYEHIRNLSNTGSQDNLSLELIKSISFPSPSLAQQRNISNLMSGWEAAIQNLDCIIAAKEQELRWNTKRIFGDTRGWKNHTLSEFCVPVNRKNRINEKKVLTSSAQHGLVIQSSYYNKSVSGIDLSKYSLLKNGEFAYNRSTSEGYPFGAIKRLDSVSQGLLSTLYLCFKISNLNETNSDFLCEYFESGAMNLALGKICQAGARSHGLLNVSKSGFFKLKVSLPTYEKQTRIAQAIGEAKREVSLLKKQAAAYRRQKYGLMQKLLTGEWRVKP
jgi:type I restriction enzyme, S subunit